MLLEGHAAINELAKESVVHLLDLAKDTLELSIQLMVNNFTVFREIGNFVVDIELFQLITIFFSYDLHFNT